MLVTGLASCDRSPAIRQLTGEAQGTTWHVSYWSMERTDDGDIQSRLEHELARIDRQLSNYRPDSTIERFNSQTGTLPISVGEEIVSLVRTAADVSQKSGGCFDLTVAPLMHLWGLDGYELNIPSEAALSEVLKTVGYERLAPVSDDRIQKAVGGLRVDLSAIAQGYTVGRLASILESQGARNYLVELGGELQVRGEKPDGQPWRIGVERPLPGGLALQKTLTIRRQEPVAVMTSGTYRHFFDDAGRRYSHIIDARTGSPVQHATVSVTVVHDDPTRADAWSTALLCLGRDAGIAVADREQVAALFVEDRGGALVETASEWWMKLAGVQTH